MSVQNNISSNAIFTVDEIYEKSKKPNTRSKTVVCGSHIYQDTIGKKYGNRTIQSITSDDIQKCLNALRNKQSDVIPRVLTIWKRLYKTCSKLGLNISDKTLSVSIPKSKKVKNHPLSQEGLEIIIQCLQPDQSNHDEQYQYERNRIVYFTLLLYYTNMNPAEILALTVDEINTVNHSIRVYKRVETSKDDVNQITQVEPVYEKRTLLNGIATETCVELIQTRRSEYLFAHYDGSVWGVDELKNSIYKLTEKEELNFRLGDLARFRPQKNVSYNEDGEKKWLATQKGVN